MITLGLDPSLTGFGWCVHDNSVGGEARVRAKGVFSTPSKWVFVKRYIYLRERTCELLERYPVEAMGVESPLYGEEFSEGMYGLFVQVNEAAYLSRKDVVYFDPTSLKSLARMDPKVRRGRMEKADMVDAARGDTGIQRWNHNEADAFIVARQAARFWNFVNGKISEDELTPSERNSYARIHTYTRGRNAGKTTRAGLAFKENSRYFRFSQLAPEDVDVET